MPCNPFFYSFLVLLPEESFLFIEESRLNWPVSPSETKPIFRSSHILRYMHLSIIVSLTRHSIISLSPMLQRLNDGGLIQEVQYPLYKPLDEKEYFYIEVSFRK